jgi:FKBP-type peptidyl-prolyl cis-trans isomerase 2
MGNEKTVAITLIVIIVLLLSALLILTNENIFKNIFSDEDGIEENGKFIMRSHIEEGHTFSISLYYSTAHFKAIEVNDTHVKFAMNVGAPELYFVNQTLVFDLSVEKVYITPPQVDIGDCVDVNYIGRFQVNNTVFDTSYEDIANQSGIYNELRTYEPLKIFVDPNFELSTPENYSDYTSSMIPGFINGLIGMNESENKTVVIPPEEAYGIWDESLAELYDMSSYPLETEVNYTIVEPIGTFEQFFPTVDLTEGNTFDYGEIAFESAGVLNATILKITEDEITYKLLPENGAGFVLPVFNWYVSFIVE